MDFKINRNETKSMIMCRDNIYHILMPKIQYKVQFIKPVHTTTNNL